MDVTVQGARPRLWAFVVTPGVPVVLLTTLYLVVVPSRSLIPAAAYDEQRTFQAWLIAAAVVTVLLDPRVRGRVVGAVGAHRVAAAVVAAVGLLGVVSAVAGPDPFGSLLEVGLFAGVLVVAACVAVAVVEARVPVTMLVLVASSVALLLFAGDLLTAPGLEERDLYARGRSGGFANVRFMNHFHVALLPLSAVLVAAQNVPGWIRGVALLAPASAAFYLFQTESRGGLLALLLAIAAVLVTRWRTARWWGIGTIASLLAGLAATVAVRVITAGGPGAPPLDQAALTDTSFRRAMWADALEVVQDRPLLGLGPGGFAFWDNEPLLFGPFAHPHNSVLQVAAEWGLPVGLLAALTLVAIAVTLTLRPRCVEGAVEAEVGVSWSAVEAGASASLLAMLLESGVASVLMTPVSLVALGLVAGHVVGVRGLAAPEPFPGGGSARSALVVALVAALALAPVTGVLLRDVDDLERERCLSLRLLGGYVAPRFWEQGFRGLPEDDCEFEMVQVGS